MGRTRWYIWCMSFLSRAACILLPCALVACSSTPAEPEVEHLSVEVLGTASLPANSFTQGLETDPDGNLLLGTGQWGESRLERFSPETGETLAETHLDNRYFGEGITQAGDSIWQLTWKSGQALKYDHDLRQVDTATYSG